MQKAGVIPKGTRVGSKAALADLLGVWYRETTEVQIGPGVTYGGQPWVWVDLDPHPVKLHADTSREAVCAYLDDVAERGAEVPWYAVANERNGRVNKVLYRVQCQRPRRWYCYLVHEVAEPCELQRGSERETAARLWVGLSRGRPPRQRTSTGRRAVVSTLTIAVRADEAGPL